MVKKQGGKKKKQILKFTLDCTHPVEDGIMDAANFVSNVNTVHYFLRRVSWRPTLFHIRMINAKSTA